LRHAPQLGSQETPLLIGGEAAPSLFNPMWQ
jgi:hypothetical protein